MAVSRNVPGEQTRAQILDVALELFAAQGFAATSTRELSERLGFTKAALYYHFRTKDDLLAALVQPGVDELSALVEEHPSALSAAARRDVLARYLQVVVANQRVIQVLSQDPSVAKRPVMTASAPLYERLAVLLAGETDPGPDVRARVWASLGAVHAALLRAERTDPPDVVQHAALCAACGALGIPEPRKPKGLVR